ncbi:MAG: hypothetical protein DRJ10_02080 [Bacteroidetes bacterium]|nr:MAG: hypothetical protein DRJ10_02080 [Bacteroidota bacterium]
MKNFYKLLIFTLIIISTNRLISQTFDTISANLPGVSNGSITWGDYDSDGYLDILLIGYTYNGYSTKIIRNNGNDTFSEQTGISLPGVRYSSADWGDYDNDGDLDILLTGQDENYKSIAKIYKNNNGTDFVEQTSVILTGVSDGYVDWGDYDNDGDLDILLIGYDLFKIYKNNGDNSFTEQTGISLTGIRNGSVNWQDFDKDGDLDILFCGNNGSNDVCSIYINNGNNTFTEQSGIDLSGLYEYSASWADYDGDGDIDILLTGLSGINNPFIKIFKNNSPGSGFTELSDIDIAGVDLSSVSWGDYDNDGDLDLLLTGDTSNSYYDHYPVSKIYNNDGDDSFTEQSSIELINVYNSSVAWCDYDNDGDLDILLTGDSSNTRNNHYPISKIYENNSSVSNTVPEIPENLQSIVSGNQVSLHWDYSMDTETFQVALTYNLYISSTPFGLDICSPHADINTGFRRVVEPGNIRDSVYIIKNLSSGTYYWSVQTIDHAYAGSDFATEGSFTVSFSNSISPVEDQFLDTNQNGNPLTINETETADSRQWKYSLSPGGPYNSIITGETSVSYTPSITDNSVFYVICESVKDGNSVVSNEVKIQLFQFKEETNASLPGITGGVTTWGDYDDDGDLDILISGYTGNNRISSIYRNDGSGSFIDINANLTAVSYGADGAWGDYDNDGDLDILLVGRSTAGRTSKIYRNNGDGTFSEQTGIILTGVDNAAVAWGDYDNDGDLDILLTGKVSDDPFIPISKIYKNNGNNTFTEQSSIILTAVDNGAVSWSDYDKDGDLDILLTGYNDIEQTVSKIYLNNGDETFDDQTSILLAGVSGSAIAWGDYNDDGYPDILLTGYNFDIAGSISKIYKNNKDNSFSEQTGIMLTPVESGSVTWADYDNDGDLDILLTGNNNTEGRISKIYNNIGDNLFMDQSNLYFTGVNNSSVSWGDYDNDLDLDILLSGNPGTGMITKVYNNISETTNTRPTAPRNLSISINGNDVTFSWSGSYDNESNRMTYNIRIGTSHGVSDLKSPMASLDSSTLMIPYKGNVGFRTSWTIKNLAKGDYYWSVQSIDQGLLASEFATEKAFAKDYFTDSGFNNSGIPGDYDRDGDLDFLGSSTVLRNDGNGFTDINAGLPGGMDNALAWGDYDNDGDLDIVYTGYVAGVLMTKIFRNDGSDTFNEIDTDMQGIWMGTVALGDYDNDGDLDLFLYGSYQSSDDGDPIGKLYRNDGDDVFTDTEIDIEDSRRGAVSLGDFNNDGYLDILASGFNISGNKFTSVLKNNENNTFTNINADIPGFQFSSSDWGDYNNDGLLDFTIGGDTYTVQGSTKIFKNNGNNTFTDLGFTLPGQSSSYSNTTQWGDYDNDGDADILVPVTDCILRNDGNDNFTALSIGLDVGGNAFWGDIDNDGDLDIITSGHIYFNTIETSNSSPEIITGLQAKVIDNHAFLSWPPSTDAETPTKGLSYNVRVGTTPGGCEILSPMTDLTLGYRRALPDMGNAWADTFKIIKELPIGTYFWSVQTVDNGHLASDFATEQSFEILPLFTKINNLSGYWGDYDNDGDLDIMGIQRNDGNDIFTPVPVRGGVWGDYDSDGDLDIITSDTILINDQSDLFTKIGIDLSYPVISSDHIGDYDGDGDLDFLTTSVIYKNEGNNVFTEISYDSSGYSKEFICWADYDNDGDLDIAFTSGSYHDSYIVTKILRNDNHDIFTDINAGLIGLIYSALSWADYDNDGDLDLLVTGKDDFDYSNNITRLYKNEGNDTFKDTNTNIRGMHNADMDWGDYNNDGFQDIILDGWSGRNHLKIYQNNQDGTFKEITIDEDFDRSGNGRWGDYDNDGDLDLLIGNGLYRNNTNYPNIKPQFLSNLKAELIGFEYNLSWDKSTDQNGTGFSYNLRIGITPGGCEIKAPMADHINGYRRMPTMGNIQSNTSWIIRNLPVGIYYWSVQAISQNYTGGDWAPELSFEMPDISADFDADTVCFGALTTFTDNSLSPEETITNWNWDFGDGINSTVQSPTHLYTQPGTYSVSLEIQTASYIHSIIKNVIVKASPIAIFSVDSVCQGSMITYINSSQTEGVTVSSWNWDLGDGTNFTVQHPPKHGYLNPGIYPIKLIITAENGCIDSTERNAIVVRTPSSTITYTGGPCYDTISRLNADTSSLYNYQWYYNEVLISGATSYSVHPAGNATYKVNITPVACPQISASYVLNYTSGPAKPEMYLRGPVVWYIACSDTTATTYKWYKNGTEIPNSNKQIIVPNPANGSYYVELNDGGECWTKSETVVIPDDFNSGKFKSFEEFGDLQDVETGMALFPNPNNGRFTFLFKNDFTGKIYLKIKDINGKTIRQYYADKALPVYFEEMDLNKDGSGIYFIEIEYRGKKEVKKVVIE